MYNQNNCITQITVQFRKESKEQVNYMWVCCADDAKEHVHGDEEDQYHERYEKDLSHEPVT